VKLYTGSGDHGKTGLFSGERVSKTDPRIQASGSLDELNSILGALVTCLPEDRPVLIEELGTIQTHLFEIGTWLSTTPGSPAMEHLGEMDDHQVVALETWIDRLQTEVPPLTRFILPGGHTTSAWAHMARAVCRRTEGQVVTVLADCEPYSLSDAHQIILRYLNRLSDYLFALARYCNHIHGVKDIQWKGPDRSI
jgi:cob(I)alamin adenosyltransferase